jgi:hypothetical protein
MMDSFTPEDNKETDNGRHKLIRAQTTEPIRTEDDTLFTPAKVSEAVKGMNKNKAPGEDNVTSDILQHAFNLLLKSTTAKHNG